MEELAGDVESVVGDEVNMRQLYVRVIGMEMEVVWMKIKDRKEGLKAAIGVVDELKKEREKSKEIEKAGDALDMHKGKGKGKTKGN
jgi:hypothetical protein